MHHLSVSQFEASSKSICWLRNNSPLPYKDWGLTCWHRNTRQYGLNIIEFTKFMWNIAVRPTSTTAEHPAECCGVGSTRCFCICMISWIYISSRIRVTSLKFRIGTTTSNILDRLLHHHFQYPSSISQLRIWNHLVFPLESHTVDGQNPAPPRMIIIPLFIGF